MTRNEQFRLYMKAANETSGKHGDHLNEAQMLAYCRGLIPTAEREAAESHIVECEQCITLFRSARDFLEPGFENEVIDKAEMNLTWQSPWSRVGGGGGPGGRGDGPPRRRTKRGPSEDRLSLANPMVATCVCIYSRGPDQRWFGLLVFQASKQNSRASTAGTAGYPDNPTSSGRATGDALDAQSSFVIDSCRKRRSTRDQHQGATGQRLRRFGNSRRTRRCSKSFAIDGAEDFSGRERQ